MKEYIACDPALLLERMVDEVKSYDLRRVAPTAAEIARWGYVSWEVEKGHVHPHYLSGTRVKGQIMFLLEAA